MRCSTSSASKGCIIHSLPHYVKAEPQNIGSGKDLGDLSTKVFPVERLNQNVAPLYDPFNIPK